MCWPLRSIAAESPTPPLTTVPGSNAPAAAGAELQVRAASPDAQFTFEENVGLVSDPGGVVVTYKDARLTADKIRFNRETFEVEAEGNVRLQRGGEMWTGDRVYYNFATRTMRSDKFRAGFPPFFAAGDALGSTLTNQVHSATNVVITSDDYAEPSYRVRAREMKFIPGQLIEARRATIFLGKVPVMYYPVYKRHLEGHRNYWVVNPGYRSAYGPYLLTSYHWMANTNLSGAVHLDLLERRGIGVGPDFEYDLGKAGQGKFQSYYINDQNPLAGSIVGTAEDDRYRIGFSHTAVLRTNFTARVTVHKQSDSVVIRDFFESEYRADPQPKTFLELNQAWSNFDLSFYAQPQVNDFFQTVERLPEVKLTGYRQQLGVSPVYYESESSLDYLRFRSVDVGGTNYAAFRADTYHQLVLPQNFFGWLQVTPRAGARFTHYGEPDSPLVLLGEENRWVFNTGGEVSTKFSRVWPGAENKLFRVNGLRHIVEPSINYVYVPEPDVRPFELPQFDSELRSLRLTPIEYPDYTAIDSIDSQNVLRLGLRNKLQTKRSAEIQDLVKWALYTDWRLRPRPSQGTFADVYSDLDFRPRSWITLNSETRFNMDDGNIRIAQHAATLTPGGTWSWRLGHRYLRSSPDYGLGNNLILSSLTLRLNENWATRFTHHFEARDGVLEEQYYTVFRDFRSWTAALTLRLRDSRGGKDDVTIAISFSLKAFPRSKQDRDGLEHGDLFGG